MKRILVERFDPRSMVDLILIISPHVARYSLFYSHRRYATYQSITFIGYDTNIVYAVFSCMQDTTPTKLLLFFP